MFEGLTKRGVPDLGREQASTSNAARREEHSPACCATSTTLSASEAAEPHRRSTACWRTCKGQKGAATAELERARHGACGEGPQRRSSGRRTASAATSTTTRTKRSCSSRTSGERADGRGRAQHGRRRQPAGRQGREGPAHPAREGPEVPPTRIRHRPYTPIDIIDPQPKNPLHAANRETVEEFVRRTMREEISEGGPSTRCGSSTTTPTARSRSKVRGDDRMGRARRRGVRDWAARDERPPRVRGNRARRRRGRGVFRLVTVAEDGADLQPFEDRAFLEARPSPFELPFDDTPDGRWLATPARLAGGRTASCARAMSPGSAPCSSVCAPAWTRTSPSTA